METIKEQTAKIDSLTAQRSSSIMLTKQAPTEIQRNNADLWNNATKTRTGDTYIHLLFMGFILFRRIEFSVIR
ncbi:unnamed protein product [Acanthoscelides obtectus]|uniref:Uncharacterized protein n=2 Tax=Acanthoscelides obtectus TaxID=200917 RepID=A0A9P0JHF9_ACAOB|nr:unnamed protein product [Acanthoscelides obtectus]CAK1661362.1 hypothetical protein AOBTE_LOCUS22576 [Acanthoscelides obtectus]